MKIFAIASVAVPHKLNSKNGNSQPITPSYQLNQLNKDTVSFKGKDGGICDSFGMIRKSNEDNLSSFFDISQKENAKGKKVLDKFVWKFGPEPVEFFGNEYALAGYIHDEKPKEFQARSDRDYSYIKYESGGRVYDLKYSKDNHELVKGSARNKRPQHSRVIEEFEIKKSMINSGTYEGKFTFENTVDNFGTASENTRILFDENMKIARSDTRKSLSYEKGGKAQSDFSRIYDEDGSVVETIDAENLYNF